MCVHERVCVHVCSCVCTHASVCVCACMTLHRHPFSFKCYSFLRKSIPRCRRINRMLSNESLHPPAFSRSNSQASVDSSTSVEEFWREIESIKESSAGAQEEQPPPAAAAEVKPVDGKGWGWTCPMGFPHPPGAEVGLPGLRSVEAEVAARAEGRTGVRNIQARVLRSPCLGVVLPWVGSFFFFLQTDQACRCS